MTEFVTPHLRTVLKTYQDNAPKSLQGPASLSLAAHHNILNNSHHYSQFNVQKREIESPPICTTSDSSIEETTDLKLMVRSPSPLVLNKHATNQSLDSSTTSTSTSSSSLQLSQSPTLLVSSIGCKNILPHPILTTSDPGCGQLLETTLEGKPIGCFLLGGEMRLCLPQILNNILFDFTLDRINRSFDELLMFCSQCTPEQLIEFKAAKILPEDVKACGLITRTNAERLCSALLHRSDRALFQTKKKLKEGVIQFKVYHRCFGKCEGICTPDLFSFKDRSCVECLECNGFFSPAKFVCHVCKDKPKENRTCHWGFDSSKWRAYLHVAFTENNRDNFTKFLDDIKDREVEYERLEREQLMENINQLKRKVDEGSLQFPLKNDSLDAVSVKKTKFMEDPFLDYQIYNHAMMYAQYRQLAYRQPIWQGKQHPLISPYAPGSTPIPYLSQEPPILQNPERVVRSTECERFERSFQPNVALAPRKIPSQSRDHTEQRDIREKSVIKCDIQIKQERPATPILKTDSPELRSTATTAIVVIKQSAISPEQSGSNEITSSTSPVPNSNNHDTIQPLLQSPLDNKNLLHQKTADLVQSKLIRVDIEMKPDNAITGHSELELSTDNSDDDSFMGEPDSSNPNAIAHPTTLKIAVDLLKNGTSENHEKILNLIKYLVKENARLKQNSFDYKKQIDQLQHNEDMMRKEQERLNRQIIVLQQNRNSAIASSSGSSSSSLSSISSCSESNSYEDIIRRKSIVEKPDVITKPLKKSVRLAPIDDVHPSSVHYNASIEDKEDHEDNELSHSVVKIEKL